MLLRALGQVLGRGPARRALGDLSHARRGHDLFGTHDTGRIRQVRRVLWIAILLLRTESLGGRDDCMTNPKPYHVLFLCTGNSARSIMAEALLNVLGEGRFEAFSAGSHPAGRVQPMAAELVSSLGYPAERLRSKSWDEFAKEGAPAMDFVITVCDNAAGEACPVWFGSPVTAHWGVPDPAHVVGDETMRRTAYRKAWLLLRKRVELFLALPAERLASLDSRRALQEIGRVGAEPA